MYKARESAEVSASRIDRETRPLIRGSRPGLYARAESRFLKRGQMAERCHGFIKGASLGVKRVGL